MVAANLVSTQLDAEDTLRLVGASFGIRTKDAPKSDILMSLEAFLISKNNSGKRCLLIVNEAQNLTARAVEELRMLSNFQFGTRPYCRVSSSDNLNSGKYCKVRK